MIRFYFTKLRQWKNSFRRWQPVVTVAVSKSAILHNLRVLRSLAPAWQIAPVLKSNAYGHGLELVAEILQSEPAIPFFCVDSYFEAERLYRAGIVNPVLIIGHTPTTTIQKNRRKTMSFVVSSLEQLKALAEGRKSQTIHLKFDTGMHRQGIPYAELSETISLLRKSTNLTIAGVLSHFAAADIPGSPLTKKQIERWNYLAERLQKEFSAIRCYHIANSAGFAYAKDVVANLGRPGLALYGINPGNLPVNLQPALSLHSIISEVRTIEAGEGVGYNQIFTAVRTTTVATVPAGYAEGVDRRLSSRGTFLVAGHPAPVIGRVSMDIATCDVTDIPAAQIGTPVTLVSSRPADPNSIETIAKLCGTIPYELLVHIPAHLRRIIGE